MSIKNHEGFPLERLKNSLSQIDKKSAEKFGKVFFRGKKFTHKSDKKDIATATKALGELVGNIQKIRTLDPAKRTIVKDSIREVANRVKGNSKVKKLLKMQLETLEIQENVLEFPNLNTKADLANAAQALISLTSETRKMKQLSPNQKKFLELSIKGVMKNVKNKTLVKGLQEGLRQLENYETTRKEKAAPEDKSKLKFGDYILLPGGILGRVTWKGTENDKPLILLESLKEGSVSETTKEMKELAHAKPIPAQRLNQLKDFKIQNLLRNYRKMGHEWGIRHSMKVGDLKVEAEGEYTGLSITHLASSVKRFFKKRENEKIQVKFPSAAAVENALDKFDDSAVITDALGRAVLYSAGEGHASEAFKDWKAGKPVILPTGWHKHDISVTLYGNYLVYTNRGERNRDQNPKMKVFKINGTVTKKIIKQIMISEKKASSKEKQNRMDWFERKAGMAKDLGLFLIREVAKKDQKVGNCSWANAKGGVHGILLLREYKRQKNAHSKFPDDAAEEISTKIFKEWETESRLHMLEDFLNAREPMKDDYREADHFSALALIGQKLTNLQKNFYDKNLHSKMLKKLGDFMKGCDYQVKNCAIKVGRVEAKKLLEKSRPGAFIIRRDAKSNLIIMFRQQKGVTSTVIKNKNAKIKDFASKLRLSIPVVTNAILAPKRETRPPPAPPSRFERLKNFYPNMSKKGAELFMELHSPGSWIVHQEPGSRDYFVSYQGFAQDSKGRWARAIIHEKVGSRDLGTLLRDVLKAVRDNYLRFAPALDKSLGPVWETQFFDLAMRTSEGVEKDYLLPHEVTQRFLDIRCPKDTAIQVKSMGNRYLHANKVAMPDGKTYIASQAPLKGNEELWWRGALQEGSMIIDVSSKDDKKRGVHSYYPDSLGQTKKFGSLNIKLKSTRAGFSQMPGLTKYEYDVTDSNTGKATTMTRLHYDEWKDYSATAMKNMVQLTEILDKELEGKKKPPMIHCRAGVGRTGTLITCLSNRHLLEEKKLTLQNGIEITERSILQGRNQRSPLFVQTPAQLKSIFDFLDKLTSRLKEKTRLESEEEELKPLDVPGQQTLLEPEEEELKPIDVPDQNPPTNR